MSGVLEPPTDAERAAAAETVRHAIAAMTAIGRAKAAGQQRQHTKPLKSVSFDADQLDLAYRHANIRNPMTPR